MELPVYPFLYHAVIVRLPKQVNGAGGIDWGDGEAAAVEIEIVDAGTDCKYISRFPHHASSQTYRISSFDSHAQWLSIFDCKRDVSHVKGPEGVARGEDALTILENAQSRSQFIDELMEVKTNVDLS